MKRLMVQGLQVVLVLAAAPPAHADWQYTRWGMTVEEALAASGGRLVPAQFGRADSDERGELQGAHEIAGAAFTLYLFFRAGGLSKVVLNGYSTEGCGTALNALRERATPEVLNEKRGSEAYLWRSIDPRSIIRWGSMRAIKEASRGVVSEECQISYSPVPSNDGI